MYPPFENSTTRIAIMQNNMLRVIYGLRLFQCVNMQRLREKIKMMSVNQMAVYHMIMEVFNIIYNSSLEQIQNKYIHQERHSLRKNANNFIRVAEIPKRKNCTGFQTTLEKHKT